ASVLEKHKPRLTGDNVYGGLSLAVVMVPRVRRRCDMGLPHPQLLGPDRSTGDRLQSSHSTGLRSRTRQCAGDDMRQRTMPDRVSSLGGDDMCDLLHGHVGRWPETLVVTRS